MCTSKVPGPIALYYFWFTTPKVATVVLRTSEPALRIRDRIYDKIIFHKYFSKHRIRLLIVRFVSLLYCDVPDTLIAILLLDKWERTETVRFHKNGGITIGAVRNDTEI